MNRVCTSCCVLTEITKICSLPFVNDEHNYEKRIRESERNDGGPVHSGIIIIEKYNLRDAIVLNVHAQGVSVTEADST